MARIFISYGPGNSGIWVSRLVDASYEHFR